MQPRSHRSYCRRKVTIDSPRQDNERSSSTIQRTSNKLFCPNSWLTNSMSFVPLVDNRLYFDPNLLFRIATPAMDTQSLEHAIRSSRLTQRHHHHHHHHHHPPQSHRRHHHHHRRHHRKHRRVVSDPGMRNWNAGNQNVKRHRRMFSYDTGITRLRLMEETSVTDADKEVPSHDETRTSTFRKVPWHPNLHMLKIRRA
ncbi:hypothetical protein ANTRET_LOCUS3629 [Anthophora retusa]